MEIRDIKRITPNKLRGVYAGCTNGKPTVWTSESVQFSQVLFIFAREVMLNLGRR